MAAHAISRMGIALGDGEFETLAVTSRELMEVERAFKGFSAQSFFQVVTMENLYKVAYVTLKRRGDERVDPKMRFDAFCDAWSVNPTDPAETARRMAIAKALAAEGATIEEINAAVLASEDEGGEADPTHPTV